MVWKWLIDLSAALLIFVSLTGLVLLYFLHKHRTAGVVLIGVGTVATWCVYAALGALRYAYARRVPSRKGTRSARDGLARHLLCSKVVISPSACRRRSPSPSS